MDYLMDSLAIYYHEPEHIYVWGEKLQEFSCLSSIGVDGIGKLDLPLSVQNVGSIQELYESTVHAAAIHMKDLKQVTKRLATNAMSKAIEVDLSDLKINVRVELVEMIICHRENEHEQHSNFSNGNGIVGKLILQLPVACLNGGARLVVNSDSKQRTFDFSRDSHSHFYSAGIFGARNTVNGAQFKIKANEKSPAVVLIFNLIWTDCQSIPCLTPTRFPSFLKAALAVKQCFDDYTSKSVANNFCVCLPLKNSYKETNFNFESLELMDKAFVEVIKSVKILACELVIIVKRQNRIKVVHDGVELKCEVIGILDVQLKRNFEEMGVSLYPGLVVYRNRRAEILGEFDEMAGVNNAMEKLEKRIAAAESSPQESFFFLSDLRHLLRILDVPNEERDKSHLPCISRTLLDYCSRLKASHEGALLIDLMARRLPINYGVFIFSEGDEKSLNELIVEFVTSVCGWEACSKSFIDVIEKKFDCAVCNVLMDMAVKFSSTNVEATREIVDKVIEKLLKLSTEEFQKCHYFNQMKIIAISMNQSELEDEERLENITEVLLKASFSQVCSLIEKTMETMSCKMEETFCFIVTECTFDKISPVQVYHLTNNYRKHPDLVRSLWLRICYEILNETKSSISSRIEDCFVAELTDAQRIDLVTDLSGNKLFHHTLEALAESFIENSIREETLEKILSHYNLVLLADKTIADAKFVDGFTAQMPSEKLCHLILKLFDDEGSHIKQQSTRTKFLRCLSSEILERHLWTMIKSSNRFVEVAANIVKLKDPGLHVLLLTQIFTAAHSANSQEKVSEIALFLSDLIQLLEKRNLLTSLHSKVCSFLYIWYNCMVKMIQNKKFEDMTANSFLSALIRLEAKKFISEEETIYEKFTVLSVKFPLILIKQLIVKASEENWAKSPRSMQILKNLCVKFTSHVNLENSFQTFRQGELLPLFKTFLMLKEQEQIKRIGELICLHPLPDPSFAEFAAELKQKKLSQLARETYQGTKMLCLIIKKCIAGFCGLLEHSKVSMSGKSWALPVDPGIHNEAVNKFLMSDKQTARFGSYRDRYGASRFGKRAIRIAEWGVECQAVLASNKKFACQLVKTKQFLRESPNVSEIRQLTDLLADLTNGLACKKGSFLKKMPLGTSKGDNSVKSKTAVAKKKSLIDETDAEPASKLIKMF